MREKLIELLMESVSKFCKLSVIRGTTKITAISVNADEFADHLIANGVTIPVRCKECKKRYDPNRCPMCILVYGEQHDFAQENGYCDRGEGRTDDRETG